MPFAVLPILSAIWGSSLGRIVAVGVLAFTIGWMKGWSSVPRVDVDEVKRLAWEQRDSEWRAKLAEKEQEHEEKMVEAIAARDSVPVLAPDADIRRLCESTASCRDKGQRRQ